MASTGSAISLTLRFVAAAGLFALALYLAMQAVAGWYGVFSSGEGAPAWMPLAHTAAAVFVGRILWRLLTWDPQRHSLLRPRNPLQRARDALDHIGRLVDVAVPDPEDVPLPPGAGTMETTAEGLHIEFPQARSVIGLGSTVLLAVIFGAILFGESASLRTALFIVPMAAIFLAWPFYLSLRARYWRCLLDVSPAGLVVCRGWGDRLDCRHIAREEVDFLEPRFVMSHGAETFFEIAAFLSNDERVVLGENLPGQAVADTVVRRIGATLGLAPDQVLTTVGAVRRQLRPLRDVLGGPRI